MTRKLITLTAAVAAVGLAPVASAAEKDSVQPKVGIGFGFSPLNVNLASTTMVAPPVQLYVPINITDKFRLEPSIGAYTFSETGASTFTWNLGVGGFYMLHPVQPLGLYGGMRIGLAFQKVTNGAGNPVTATGFGFAPAAGVEYALVPHFTFGAEVQLWLSWPGDQTTTAGGVAVTPQANRFSFATDGTLFVRYYFL